MRVGFLNIVMMLVLVMEHKSQFELNPIEERVELEASAGSHGT